VVKRIYIISFSLCLTGFCVPQIQVLLQQPPPHQFKLEHMWRVTLNNPTDTIFRVYLYGVAVEAHNGFIVDAITGSFTLPPGRKKVTASDIRPIDIQNTNDKYEAIVKNTGNVPSGDYEICVTVRDAETHQDLGSDCIQQQVFNFTQVELLFPPDGSEIDYAYPIFNWLPPSPLNLNQKVTYTIQISEILSRQSAYDAMQSNPLFLEAKNLHSAMFQFPVWVRHLVEGRRYAWRVLVYLNNVLVSESEIWEFKFTSNGDWVITIGLETSESEIQKLNLASRREGAIDESSFLRHGVGGKLSPLIRGREREKVFSFSGSSKVEGLNSNRPGTGQTVPQRYANWEINPGISIYKIPFSLSILLSSQGSEIKQNINSIAFLLKPETIQSMIQEKAQQKLDELQKKAQQEIDAKLKKSLKEEIRKIRSQPQSVLSGPVKTFSWFKSLGIGVTYPVYSPYILSGVPVTGADIEFNPGLFYVAVTGLKNQKPIDNISYRRNLYAGRIGVGSKEASHFYLTFMYARDDENSISVSDTNLTLTPKVNYVFGSEGKINLFKSILSLEADFGAAMLTRDVRDADLQTTAIPQWMKDIVHPKISSSVDFTYGFRAVYNNEKSNTKVTAGFKMVGPGYTSLGVPNLPGDKMLFDLKANQKFMDRKISVNAFVKRERDNLLDWKTSTTSVTAIGLNVGLNFKNYPFVRLLYNPYFQKNNASSDTFKVDNTAQIFTFVSGYNFRKWDLNFSNSLSYSLQQNKSFGSLNDFTSHNLIFTENITFTVPLTVAASFGLIYQKHPAGSSRILTLDLSTSYTAFELWNNTAGVNFAVERDRNRKLGVYVNSTITFLKYITLDVRAEQNVYRDYLLSASNYNEFILRSILSANW
jgi:hypothetical protein